jgi:hypothetical protein
VRSANRGWPRPRREMARHHVAQHGQRLCPTAPPGGVTIDVTLGVEHASSTAVHWVPGRQSNGFFLILGASGSGKTETLKVLGESVVEAGVPVLVFDFHGRRHAPWRTLCAALERRSLEARA